MAIVIPRRAIESGFELAVEHGQRLTALAFFKCFPDADNWNELGLTRRVELAVDPLVGVAKQFAAFRVPDEHVRGAGILEHHTADLAGEGALPFEVQVLSRNLDRGRARGFRRGRRLP